MNGLGGLMRLTRILITYPLAMLRTSTIIMLRDEWVLCRMVAQ